MMMAARLFYILLIVSVVSAVVYTGYYIKVMSDISTVYCGERNMQYQRRPSGASYCYDEAYNTITVPELQLWKSRND